MKLKSRLKVFWHDQYYKHSTVEGIEFAMKCKEVTEKIDLNERPRGLVGRVRFFLHLSLCRACQNYEDFSRALSNSLKVHLLESSSKLNVEALNEKLLKKHAGGIVKSSDFTSS